MRLSCLPILRQIEEYVRDVEIACLLRLMVEKELDVFVVFDCCHSGGLNRNSEATTHIRGLSGVDRLVGTSAGLTEEELDAWNRCNQGESKGYTLLAACDEHEFAREERCGEGGPRGLLTRAMWETLRERKNTERLMTNEFFRSIITFVHKRSMYQTPRLKGEGKIAFFDVEHNSSLHVTLSPKYPFSEGQELDLHAGLAHGILKKMVFAVYPGSQPDFADVTKRLAYAEVQRTEPLSSIIKITSVLNAETTDWKYLFSPIYVHCPRFEKARQNFKCSRCYGKFRTGNCWQSVHGTGRRRCRLFSKLLAKDRDPTMYSIRRLQNPAGAPSRANRGK